MKNLLLFFSLFLCSNPILGVSSRKALLKEQKCAETIRKNMTTYNDILNCKHELIDRDAKLKSQKISYTARLDHFVKKGILPLLQGSFLGFCSYELMKKSFNQEFSSLNRNLFILSSVGLGYLGLGLGIISVKSIYNNLVNWHERKNNKIRINNKALIKVQSLLEQEDRNERTEGVTEADNDN